MNNHTGALTVGKKNKAQTHKHAFLKITGESKHFAWSAVKKKPAKE